MMEITIGQPFITVARTLRSGEEPNAIAVKELLKVSLEHKIHY
jgi:hypothetical protein